jgi:hypothetical protein
MTSDKQKSFIFETLIQFDQILKITTIDVWQPYTNKLKQQTAASKLEARMNTAEAITASASTALAITKATETAEELSVQSQQATLHLSNLERALKRKEQKTNEVSKAMKLRAKNHKKTSMVEGAGSLHRPSSSILTSTTKNKTANGRPHHGRGRKQEKRLNVLMTSDQSNQIIHIYIWSELVRK